MVVCHWCSLDQLRLKLVEECVQNGMKWTAQDAHIQSDSVHIFWCIERSSFQIAVSPAIAAYTHNEQQEATNTCVCLLFVKSKGSHCYLPGIRSQLRDTFLVHLKERDTSYKSVKKDAICTIH